MRQNFNYHTHTYRCGHATGTDEEYVQAAIEAGYKTLGFSDHSPYKNFPIPTVHMNWDMFDDYVESITNLKEKYKGIIDIKLGIESEYYRDYVDEKLELREKLDYMILGQHFVNPDGSGSYFRNNTDEEIMIYANQVCEALDTGIYDYLCHPDVFLNRQEVFNDTCAKVAHMIGKKAVETNTPVELNIRGIIRGRKLNGNYFYPNREFWKILSQYPIKVIIGIDAHDPNDLRDIQIVEEGLNEVADLNLDFIKEPLFK